MFKNPFAKKNHNETEAEIAHLLPANPEVLAIADDPEAGATTLEYGMLAGGVAVTGGLLYQIVNSPFFQDLVKKIFEKIAEMVLSILSNAVGGVLMPFGF